MTGYLTTHVLDTARGCPAQGLKIDLHRIDDASHITTMTTNKDGRTNSPILPQADFSPGTYELTFHAGDYLKDHSFLSKIPIRFTMGEDQHYHIPLLLSPFSYATYRGS